MSDNEAMNGMDLAAWRQANAPIPDVLPSGLAILRRRVSLESLVFSGQVPLTALSGIALDEKGKPKVDASELAEHAEKYGAMFNAIAKASLAWPPVADEPDDEHLGVNELHFDDKMHLLDCAMEGTRGLEPFRPGQGQSDDPASVGEELPPAAEPDPGD